MTDRELMQQALDFICSVMVHPSQIAARDAIADALEKRLAQPEQEPVAHTLNCICGAVWDVSPDGVEEMVHAPNPPQRKPLTEKRIEELYSFWVVDCQDIVGFARAVERTVKGEV